MTKHTPTGELRFEQDYSAAQFDDGSVVKFTRLERRALQLFNEAAGRVLTRAQILDAVSEPGSEKNDRSIDFLINRIRGKLGDNANEPRFIRTQYGEGYVWLYAPGRVAADLSEAFSVVGPILGQGILGENRDFASEFAKLLQRDLRALLGPEQTSVIAPELTKTQRVSGPALSIQIGFFRSTSDVDCIVTTRSGKDDRILDVTKFAVQEHTARTLSLSRQSRLIAERAITTQWRDSTENAATVKPLPVAIYDSTRPKLHTWSWKDADRRLRPLRQAHPDDPAIKIMWATHIHARYVKDGIKIFQEEADIRAADEAEIEGLVLEALDYAQDRPEHAIMAAKLLYFVNQGYRDLALDLAMKAYRADRSITSTVAIFGQLLGFVGEMEEAEACLTQAVELSDEGTMEQVYALYMLIQAHAAAGYRDKLAAALRRMYRIRPTSMIIFEPFFTDPVKPSLRARTMALITTRGHATAILRKATYLSARLYTDPRHRENSLLAPVNLFVRRFGPDIVPDEVAVHLPAFRR